MPPFVFSTIASVAAGCVSAFMLLWAVLCIFYGGPEGRVNNEAMVAGIISAVVGIVAAYAAYLLHTAPARAAADPDSLPARIALKGAPFFALLFIGALWMVGLFVVLYFAFILAVVIAFKSLRRSLKR